MPLGDTFVWIIAEYIVYLKESKFQTLMKPRHLLTILALSPQASSLHDAVNYPVDGNKGAADISIPLYTVPDPMAEKYYGVNEAFYGVLYNHIPNLLWRSNTL